MKHRGVGVVAVAALIAAPVLAEKAYIPVSDGAVGRGVSYRTEITLTNAKGAPTQSVAARIGYEGGGTSAAQTVKLGGGQSQRLGLPGSGLVELDLAKGVESAAWLVVERSSGKNSRAWLPTLTAHDSMPAGSLADLFNDRYPEDYRKTSVGVVNLSSRAAKCNATFQNAEGVRLFAPIGFTVPPQSERRSGSFAGGKGGIDIDTLRYVQCDQSFWTYALAEQASTGSVKVFYPSKEVQLSPTKAPATATAEAAATSTFYSIPGQFFVANSTHWTYRYTMNFGVTKTYRKVVTDFDVYHAGWDPKKPGGIHLVLWMQTGGWGTLMEYLNPTNGVGNKFRWNFLPNGTALSKPVMKPLATYHVKSSWDGYLHKNLHVITKGGLPYASNGATLGASSFTSKSLFVQFAHKSDGPDGPEARSPNWRWSNLVVELAP